MLTNSGPATAAASRHQTQGPDEFETVIHRGRREAVLRIGSTVVWLGLDDGVLHYCQDQGSPTEAAETYAALRDRLVAEARLASRSRSGR